MPQDVHDGTHYNSKKAIKQIKIIEENLNAPRYGNGFINY